MSEVLFHYTAVDSTTWVYLSSLLMIGLFFKFSRFWSVRNLDLILLILLSPGLVLVHSGERMMANGETSDSESPPAAAAELGSSRQGEVRTSSTFQPIVGTVTEPLLVANQVESSVPDVAVPP